MPSSELSVELPVYIADAHLSVFRHRRGRFPALPPLLKKRLPVLFRQSSGAPPFCLHRAEILRLYHTIHPVLLHAQIHFFCFFARISVTIPFSLPRPAPRFARFNPASAPFCFKKQKKRPRLMRKPPLYIDIYFGRIRFCYCSL